VKLQFSIQDLRFTRLSHVHRLWAIGYCSLLLVALPATAAEEDIPPLAPPLPEILPSAWERFGWTLWIVVPFLLLLVTFGLWLILRPGKPPVLPAPAAQARSALRALQAQPESGDVLSQISQTLRRYLINTFWLSPKESTTRDFCQLLAAHERIGPVLAEGLGKFLRACDERKFAPATNSPPLGAAGRALELIEVLETARVTALKAAQTAKPA
jgi:hypothetical protein